MDFRLAQHQAKTVWLGEFLRSLSAIIAVTFVVIARPFAQENQFRHAHHAADSH